MWAEEGGGHTAASVCIERVAWQNYAQPHTHTHSTHTHIHTGYSGAAVYQPNQLYRVQGIRIVPGERRVGIATEAIRTTPLMGRRRRKGSLSLSLPSLEAPNF